MSHKLQQHLYNNIVKVYYFINTQVFINTSVCLLDLKPARYGVRAQVGHTWTLWKNIVNLCTVDLKT